MSGNAIKILVSLHEIHSNKRTTLPCNHKATLERNDIS